MEDITRDMQEGLSMESGSDVDSSMAGVKKLQGGVFDHKRRGSSMGLFQYTQNSSASDQSKKQEERDFFVLIGEASSLPNTTRNVCVVLSLGDQEARSKVLSETIFPLWNQVLPLRVAHVPCVIKIAVLGVDKDGNESILGHTELPVSDERHRGAFTDSWRPLVPDDDGGGGGARKKADRHGSLRIAASFEAETIDVLRKGLSPKVQQHQSLAQETWFQIEKDVEEVGIQFFRNVFAVDETLKEKFHFTGTDEDLYQHTALRNHGTMVLRTVGRAVAGLNEISSLNDLYVGLSMQHAGMGVQSEHLEVFLQALLWTLEDFLGPARWTEELEQAWQSVFESVRAGLLPAILERERKEAIEAGGSGEGAAKLGSVDGRLERVKSENDSQNCSPRYLERKRSSSIDPEKDAQTQQTTKDSAG